MQIAILASTFTPQKLLTGLVLAVLVGHAGLAQSEVTAERQLSLAEARSLRRQVESDTSRKDGQQEQQLDLYDQSIADLKTADQAQARIRRHERERTRIQSKVAGLRVELGRLQDRAETTLPEALSADRVETTLAREQSLLSSLRVALRDVQELAAERLRRRNEIAQRLGTLDQEIESVNTQLREASELGGSDELRQAARTRALARRAALLAGSAMSCGRNSGWWRNERSCCPGGGTWPS